MTGYLKEIEKYKKPKDVAEAMKQVADGCKEGGASQSPTSSLLSNDQCKEAKARTAGKAPMMAEIVMTGYLKEIEKYKKPKDVAEAMKQVADGCKDETADTGIETGKERGKDTGKGEELEKKDACGTVK